MRNGFLQRGLLPDHKRLRILLQILLIALAIYFTVDTVRRMGRVMDALSEQGPQ